MPLGFPATALPSAMAFEPRPGDIFVASYPKSGTTWLQYIVYLIVRRRALGAHERLTDEFPHLEEVGAGAVAGLPEPRLIKTHLAFARAPFVESARYLVVARNPFDSAVSFFHHTRGFPQHYDFADGTFAEFFECFLAGEVDFGDYFDHLLSWLEASHRANVLFLTYEALSADTRPSVRKIAAFLGLSREAASDAWLDSIVEESSLDSMRRDQGRWSSRRPDWAESFVRRGAVGDYRSLFTPAMARALLAECDRRLANSGCDALWPGMLAAVREFAAGRS